MEPCTIGGLHSSPAQAALRCLRGRAKIASAVHGITTSAARRRPGHLGHWLPGEQPTTNLHHTNQPVHDSRLSLGKGMKVRDHWPIMFVPETNQMPHIPSCLTAPYGALHAKPQVPECHAYSMETLPWARNQSLAYIFTATPCPFGRADLHTTTFLETCIR